MSSSCPNITGSCGGGGCGMTKESRLQKETKSALTKSSSWVLGGEFSGTENTM